MEIKTNYGTIDYEDLEDFDLSSETIAFIEKQKEAVEIFFGDEIDLTDADIKFDNEIKELAEVAIAENKYTIPSKAFAVSEYSDEPLTDIEEASYNEAVFEVGNDIYLVLTDEEADEYAKERALELIDDIGIDGLSDFAKEHVYANFVKTDWFDDAMHEFNEGYAYDIKDESSDDDDVYVNRLHQEMVERQILDDPEWPDESDYEFEREPFVEEEFTEPEPDADDFETDEEYSDAYDAWEQREKDFDEQQTQAEEEWDEEQDRLEDEQSDIFDDAVDEYRYKLEQEVESNIDNFVESLDNDYENGLEYYKQNFGEEEVQRIVKDQDLIDNDAVAEYLIDEDGRGYTIAPDSDEDSITVTYRGQEYEYYIYKTG